MPTIHQRGAILKQSIDVGFLYDEFSHPATKTHNFDEGEYVAALPERHPLAKKKH